MRTGQQTSFVLTVPISLRPTTPSLLTTSVLVMCTTSPSSQPMELAWERGVTSVREVSLYCHIFMFIVFFYNVGTEFERRSITALKHSTCIVTLQLVCVSVILSFNFEFATTCIMSLSIVSFRQLLVLIGELWHNRYLHASL